MMLIATHDFRCCRRYAASLFAMLTRRFSLFDVFRERTLFDIYFRHCHDATFSLLLMEVSPLCLMLPSRCMFSMPILPALRAAHTRHAVSLAAALRCCHAAAIIFADMRDAMRSAVRAAPAFVE